LEKKDIRKCEACGKGFTVEISGAGYLAGKSGRVLSALGVALRTAAK